ncbi:MAG: twin arginine-targeting protein translocase, TatA/E family [Firmicutes bacterium]|nr:twin arginine-targeting protein translocase, TatA/E family [Bacillota bacterium]
MFNFSMPELIVVLIVALVVFGPAKLPEIGRAFGKSINEFKSATNDVKEETQKTIYLETQEKPADKDHGK